MPDSKPAARPLPGRTLSRLARKDERRLRQRLAEMAPDQIAVALQELVPDLRNEILEVVECIDEVVPLLPEAELASTIVATGVVDAGWLVEFATPEQRVACVDLDCWKDARLSSSRLMEWIDALIEAGPETLAAAFEEIDLETWILAFKDMADFKVAGLSAWGDASSDEHLSTHYDTLDGVFFFAAHSSQHEERLRIVLDTALLHAPYYYWAFAYGAINEDREECEQDAGRRQAGRLNDLGFPDREHAMRAYRPLSVDSAPTVDVGRRADEPHDLVASPQLPQRLSETLVGRALAELPADRANEVLGYVLAVANTLAVADELPLAEPASIRESLVKAIRGIDRGLAELARRRDQSPAQVLDATKPDLVEQMRHLIMEMSAVVRKAELRDELTKRWETESAEEVLQAYENSILAGEATTMENFEAYAEEVLERKHNDAVLATFRDRRDSKLVPLHAETKKELQELERLGTSLRSILSVLASTLRDL